MPKYTNVPDLEQFNKDTGRTKHAVLKFLNLSDDPLMRSIDKLLEKWEFHVNGTLPLDQTGVVYVLTQLYFATNAWLNIPSASSRRKTQRPAIEALWRVVVDKMCWTFNTTVNVLPEKLELFYGKTTIKDLARQGDEENPTVYFNRVVLGVFRLVFKNGLAYMWDWYRKGHPEGGGRRPCDLRLVKANSMKAWRARTITPGFAGYVLRMDREMFMAKHRGSEDEEGKAKIAHSAYTGGMPVLCAGEIAVANGRIKCVTTGSGHYQPRPETMLHVLRTFQMHGVNLHDVVVGIELGPKEPFHRYRALDFLHSGGKTDRIDPLRGADLQQLYSSIPGFVEGTQGLYSFPITPDEVLLNMIRG